MAVLAGSTDENYNHWPPTDFSETAAALIELPTDDAGLAAGRPAVRPNPFLALDTLLDRKLASVVHGQVGSERLVEVGVVTASKLGTVLPCINWLGRPIPSFAVTLGFDLPRAPTNVSLASGAAIKVAKTVAGRLRFEFDLEVAADAVIIRL